MSEWVNRLDFSQRNVVVQMYENGISISSISKIYQVHHSSIRYHLKKADVYIAGRKSTIKYSTIKKQNKDTFLDFYNRKAQKIQQTLVPKLNVYLGHEATFPKSYEEYVQRDKARVMLLLKHESNPTERK